MTKVSAIIPAAGSGKRMGGNTSKQYLQIGGRPIIVETLSVFQKAGIINDIILVAPAAELAASKEIIEAARLSKVIAVIEGGAERQDSIRNGLALLKNDTDLVIVHDGVRPFITEEMIESSVAAAKEAGAAIVAVPVKDTVKRAEGLSVIETVPRDELWLAQTPQAFRCDIIKKAYSEAGKNSFIGTDDASLVEAMGKRVKIVPGSYENIKITTAEDLIFAEAILKNRSTL
ncbi:MAG: 2-C-methyl-D-erythritol 4-phosphate cytidylyltransferase [Proteobacteria bacterium]|nr:2-C-methyl-D-erythritol 4-phosphate cytidylyltransferase [Pseudomonadota bacterium]